MKKCTLIIILICFISITITLINKYTDFDIIDAVRMDDTKLLKKQLLIEKDTSKYTQALNEAIMLGHPGCLEALIEHIEKSNSAGWNMNGLLKQLSIYGSVECAEVLFKYVTTSDIARLNERKPESETAPNWGNRNNLVSNAVINGNIKLATYMIKKGLMPREVLYLANPNSPEELRSLFEALLDADIEAGNLGGWSSAMEFAAEQGDLALIDKILDKTSNMAINYGLSSKYDNIQPGVYKWVFNKKSLEYLFLKGADPGSEQAELLLYFAVEEGNYEIVRLLIDKGVHVYKSILAYSYTSNKDVVELLMKNGADVNPDEIGHLGREPLVWAISGIDPDMVDFWLKNGARTNTNKHTPSDLLNMCKEIREKNVEWFDFVNKDRCKRIEESIRKYANQ
jgi:ankyrin repeat protein